MTKGWIKAFRKIKLNELYFCEPFDKTHAWLDILLCVNDKEHDAVTKKGVIHLMPGQGIFSEEMLSNRWQWSRNRTRRYLKLLSDLGMVQITGTVKGTVLTVVNWEKYQGRVPEKSTEDGTESGTEDGTEDGTLCKKIRREEEKKGGADAPFPPGSPDPHATDDAGIIAYMKSKGYE